MTNDELHEFDLSAWEVPAPRDGLADAVIAHMREPAAVGAIEPEGRGPRWWWIAGGLAAAAVALVLALVIVLGGSERAAPAAGAVAADRARPLELGTASAQLDAGVVVAWHRERGAL